MCQITQRIWSGSTMLCTSFAECLLVISGLNLCLWFHSSKKNKSIKGKKIEKQREERYAET